MISAKKYKEAISITVVKTCSEVKNYYYKRGTKTHILSLNLKANKLMK